MSRGAPGALLSMLVGILTGSGAALADRVRVEIEGIDGRLEENVRLHLTITGLDDASADRIQRVHARAEDEAREALEVYGHYRPTIDSDLERNDGDRWTARYRIDPGPVIRMADVDVRATGPGAEEPGLRQRLDSFPLSPGDPLDHTLWTEGKATIEAWGAAHGYLDAELVQHEIKVDVDAGRADLVLEYATGERFRFGEVVLAQQVLEPEVIRGYLTFESGDPFDSREILELQTALSSSPYFARVEVVPRRDLASGDRRVPVHVRMIPQKRQRWTVGAGYGSDTEARFKVALDHRRINSRGHRGTAEIQLSAIESSGQLQYRIPGPYPRTDEISIGAGYSDISSDTVESRSSLVSVGRTETRRGWRESLALGYTVEDFEVGLDSGRAKLLVPSAGWTRVVADDRIYPLRGYRLQLGVSAAEDGLGSDASFVQGEVEGEIVREIAPGVRALGRLGLGYTATSDFRRLPPSIRYFAGGDQSVRGYAFQTLGRLDESGQIIGGEALVEASLEVDWLFYERFGRWGLAAFVDAGNASAELGTDLRLGVGGGLRWLSPVGLVRADIGWPLDEPDDGPTLHVSLGPDL